jgi:hypothetical protein
VSSACSANAQCTAYESCANTQCAGKP